MVVSPRTLAALSFLSFLITPNSFADYYRFSVQGKDFGALAQVKNCIDYNVCSTTGGVLAGDEKEYRFHTFVDLDPGELTNVLDQCSFTLGLYQASVTNLTTNQSVPFGLLPRSKLGNIQGVGSALAGAWNEFQRQNQALTERIPVFNPPYTESTLWTIHKGIQALMDGNRPAEAIAAVLKEFKFQTLGYAISLDPKMGESVLAVTNHSDKTIHLNLSTLKESCDLVYTLRHEVEHVHQMNKVLRCEAAGGSSGFDDHVERERSAYMNDVFNANRLCPEATIRKEFIGAQTRLFFRDYTKN